MVQTSVDADLSHDRPFSLQSVQIRLTGFRPALMQTFLITDLSPYRVSPHRVNRVQTSVDVDLSHDRPFSIQTFLVTDLSRYGPFSLQTFLVTVGWLDGCLTSQQQASVSQGRICSDNFTCCHTEIEVADPMFYLTQSQYTDTGPTSPSADPITPGAWQGSHWSANF